MAEQIPRHFERCKRTSPTSTMVVFLLPKWAKFKELSRHWNSYREFSTMTHLLTRQSMDDPTKQEVVARAPWPIQMWLVDAGSELYDSAPTTPPTVHVVPPLVHAPIDESKDSIASPRQIFPRRHRHVTGRHRSSPSDSSLAKHESS
jgi:hypothetical protein